MADIEHSHECLVSERIREVIKGSDTLESFLSKIAVESNLRKKLARIGHVLIVKVYFERRKIEKLFMTHVQDFFRKSLLMATFERKLSSVSLPLMSPQRTNECQQSWRAWLVQCHGMEVGGHGLPVLLDISDRRGRKPRWATAGRTRFFRRR